MARHLPYACNVTPDPILRAVVLPRASSLDHKLMRSLHEIVKEKGYAASVKAQHTAVLRLWLCCRLKDGQVIGQALAITDMDSRRRGKLGVCSQSLHADVDWLKDWVDHQFAMGANEVIMHAPKVLIFPAFLCSLLHSNAGNSPQSASDVPSELCRCNKRLRHLPRPIFRVKVLLG